MGLADKEVEYIKALDPDKTYVIGINHENLNQKQFDTMSRDIVDAFKELNISICIVSSCHVDFIEVGKKDAKQT